DMERMEVLRGPQGTLYGRNTMGGTLNIITKRPSNDFHGNVKLTLGTYEQRDLRGTLNVPLLAADSAVGELNMKISGATLNRDGLLRNTYEFAPQRELATRDREVGRMQLLWLPTDSLDVMYSYDITKIDEVPDMLLPTVINPDKPAGPVVAPYLQRRSERPRHVQVG